jgi:hypothetical protein
MTDTTIDPSALGFIGGFGFEPPEMVKTADEINGVNTSESKESLQDKTEEATKSPTDTNKPVDKPEVKVETKESLAELLRKDREARLAKTTELREASSVKEQLTKVTAELTALKNAPSFEDDPVGYCKTRKLTPEAQLALGQALIYDLAPSKAPPELRQDLYEAKRKREDAAREAQFKEQESKRQLEFVQNNIRDFAITLENASKSFTPGSYPESEAWFLTHDGKPDMDTYNRSLMVTADNMARAATERGTRADLSPSNIAKVLEDEIARRMKLRESKRKPNTQPVADKKPNVEAKVEIDSTRGLNSGSPERAFNETERVRRAILAGFGN